MSLYPFGYIDGRPMNLPFFNDEPGQGERTVLHQPSLPLPRGGAVNRVRLLPEAKPDADISDGIDGRRAKIWELGETLHCSIVGTCLSTAELRQVLTRAKVIGVEKASEHELHILGVMAASRRDVAGRFLQKALDRRHRGTLNQFARAADAAALRAMWDDAARKGDIPGAYWAVLTHPAATNDVVKHVFGEVHMLSHLVGAANRADIRRLRQLEDDNATLQAKLTRQQRHLQDAFAVRDEAVRRLNAVASVQPAPDTRTEGQAAAATQALIGDLNRRLLAQDTHIQKLQGRLDTAASSQKQAVEMQRRAQAECAAMAEELDLANARLAAAVAPGGASEDSLRLSGTTLLYVGGRAHQVPGLRALVERAGGEFLHHDGGVDDNATLLPGLVSRAALVLFPVDCISHAAMSTVKRLCGQSGKRFVPLRTASLTCLLAALAAAQ